MKKLHALVLGATGATGKEMVKLLESPLVYSTNKKIFDATLTQLFKDKKISAEVYKAAMSPKH